MTYAAGSGQTISAAAGTYNVSCTRKPIAVQGGTSVFNATALTVDTNFGGLNVFWPQDRSLPITSASELQALIGGLQSRVSSLESTTQQMQGAVNFNLLPIGSIVAWWSGGDPPKGWVKCDGTDGRAPNLTGRFLRAGSSGQVGATAGAESANVPQFGSNNRRGDGNGWSIDGNHFLSTDAPTINTVPPFTSVVYIMKVANS